MPSGPHAVAILRDGYHPFARQVTINPGLATVLELEQVLQPRQGFLTATAATPNTSMTITGGVANIERTVALPVNRLALPIGDYTASFVEPGRDRRPNLNISISEDDEASVSLAELDHEKALGTWKTKIGFSIVGAVLAAWYSFNEDQEVQDRNDERSRLNKEFSQSISTGEADNLASKSRIVEDEAVEHEQNAKIGAALAIVLGGLAIWIWAGTCRPTDSRWGQFLSISTVTLGAFPECLDIPR
ncbi:MAG: hypothetical protein IID61_17100 [SAR324 cluster bacterium]|nr:hypothetical protein [SAR324 cluster bacterium]